MVDVLPPVFLALPVGDVTARGFLADLNVTSLFRCPSPQTRVARNTDTVNQKHVYELRFLLQCPAPSYLSLPSLIYYLSSSFFLILFLLIIYAFIFINFLAYSGI